MNETKKSSKEIEKWGERTDEGKWATRCGIIALILLIFTGIIPLLIMFVCIAISLILGYKGMKKGDKQGTLGFTLGVLTIILGIILVILIYM